MLSRRVAIGFAAGFAIGLSDVVLFKLLDVEMLMGGDDVTIPIILFFSISFGLLGAVVGRVWDQREVIRDQLEALRKARLHAVEQEKLATVGRLASGVAHEVRNPLGVIRSSASLLGEDLVVGSDEARAAGFIVDEVDRLDDFVTRLLDFTRPLAARPSRQSVEMIVRAATRTDHGELQIELAEADVWADEALLTQALRNLIVNARAVADRVRIEVEREAERDDGTIFRVRDDGPGVLPEHRDSLFEPFFTTKADGTGLGLAMAQKVAEVHNGTLRYIDGRGLADDGAGACFELMISTESR